MVLIRVWFYMWKYDLGGYPVYFQKSIFRTSCQNYLNNQFPFVYQPSNLKKKKTTARTKENEEDFHFFGFLIAPNFPKMWDCTRLVEKCKINRETYIMSHIAIMRYNKFNNETKTRISIYISFINHKSNRPIYTSTKHVFITFHEKTGSLVSTLNFLPNFQTSKICEKIVEHLCYSVQTVSKAKCLKSFSEKLNTQRTKCARMWNNAKSRNCTGLLYPELFINLLNIYATLNITNISMYYITFDILHKYFCTFFTRLNISRAQRNPHPNYYLINYYVKWP